MSNKLTNLIAAVLLLVLFWTALLSMGGTSLTFDELAHIPAGYSYLSHQDYRVNPEHPPLIKDLSAVPLLFQNLNFPEQSPVWLQEETAPAWWIQFDLGTEFIYNSQNNPTDIIFWARLPMILLLVLLGWFLFRWARKLGGNLAGLGALALFSFSPTFIAHGRLVTTDVGAALGAVIATYFWLKFLKNPTKLNILWAGVFFGIAMLIKFSLILLVPFFGLLAVIYPFLLDRNRLSALKEYLSKSLLAGIIGVVLIIYPVYCFHTLNYPAEHQLRDTAADLAPNQITPLKNLTIWMADKPVIRPLGQYARGLMMATQRTSFGNTTYFMGEISAQAWWYYFPVIYFLKTPLAFHFLILIVLLGLCLTKTKREGWLKNNFTAFSFLLFIFIYWIVAVTGNLNIGVRHLMPTIPFIYLLVIMGLKRIMESPGRFKKPLQITLATLFIWYASASLSAFPHYISYYNEAAGGTENGYFWAVDSNYDWGQDFYRLMAFMEEKDIQKIHLDYFGGENPRYWLGEKYVKLNPKEIKEPPKEWVAVSMNQLMGGVAEPVPGFDQETGYYSWLQGETPVARAGYSILIYDLR